MRCEFYTIIGMPFYKLVDLQIFKVKSFIFFNIWKYSAKGKKVKVAQLKVTIKQ